MSNIDAAVVDGLKALDPERPIREADIAVLSVRANKRRSCLIEKRCDASVIYAS